MLIVTSDTAQIDELVKCLYDDGIKTTVESFEKISKDPQIIRQNKIVLFYAEYAESTNLQVIKYLRSVSKWPVYVLTEHEDLELIKLYLSSGAEGYFPFSMPCEIVTGRLKAVYRYIEQHVYKTNEIVSIAGVTIDLDNRMILTKSKKHKLTLNEYQIIKVLVAEKNRVVSKDELIARIWDHHTSATDNALGIHISRLRKKTISDENQQLIETIWGVGYRLNTNLV